MRQCASCGAENPADDRFCGNCGAKLAEACPACGAAADPGRRFCGKCGTPLGQLEASASVGRPHEEAAPSPPVSERRMCSVLFADLVGFTPLSEARDPEEVREILSRYFEVARRIMARYGGIVEKFIGDAVMAVWGTPIADEGDAERAVRAALELVDAVGVLGTEVGATGLAARAGIVTGEVAVTLGAEGEGMVAGDAVNTAARVQSVARPGTVFCDDGTRKLAERAIAFHGEGAFELKGKAKPEQLYSAERVLSGMGGNQRSGGLEAPFIGRDAELRTIKDLFHACAERRVPRLVVVTGPAGVGKSRLEWEFEKYVDGLADVVLWHRGRCLSYGEGVAFWALAEIVRQRFGIAQEDPSDVAEAKLREGMVRFVRDEVERDYVGVRLSRLLGVPYGPPTKAALSQEELFAGWRLFFEHLAQVAPVVLLVEDANYGDEGMLGFLEHLVDWTRGLPIFVLLFARPGHAAIDSGYGIGRNRSTLSLDPLDDASMRRLVGSLVPAMPDGALDTITARAQGVPLFAVETVRALIDQRAVERDADGYRLVGELGTLSVPATLHALLAARLDALPPTVRALVGDASVVGSSFPKDALVAVSKKDDGTVQAGLDELVQRDVLQVLADPLSPERGAYRFSQELLRQVAYETLSKKDRKIRHLAAAAHMRVAFANDGEEIADAIARHYLDALAAGPADQDAEELKSDALRFLVRAAQRAARSGAPAQAADIYAKASGVAPPEQAAVLLEAAVRANDDAGDYEVAIAQAEAAAELHLARGDRRGVARVQSLKGSALRRLGRHVAARSALSEALEVLREEPDSDTVDALRNLASLETFSGNVEESRQLVTEALALGQALGMGEADLSQLFITRGIQSGVTDRLVEAACDLREGARLAERAGDYGTLGRAELNLADVLLRRDPPSAADAARSAATHIRRAGQQDMLGFALCNQSIALMEFGEWDQAAALLHDALHVEGLEHEILRCVNGILSGLRGDGAGAASAQETMGRYRQSEDPQDQAVSGLLDACAALCAEDPAGALAHAMAVLHKVDALGIGSESQRWTWPLAARAGRSLGDTATLETLLASLDAHPVGHLPPILRAERQLVGALMAADAQGRPDAHELGALADAIGALRQVGNPYQLAHGLLDYAETLMRSSTGHDDKDPDTTADAAIAEAKVIAERLGCQPLLERAAGVRSMATPADTSN